MKIYIVTNFFLLFRIMSQSKLKINLPSYIGTFKSLTILYDNYMKISNFNFLIVYILNRSLSSCNIFGSIPSSMGDLVNLVHLFVLFLEDSLLKHTNREFRSLGINHLCGEIPSSIGNLVNLKVLYVKSYYTYGYY